METKRIIVTKNPNKSLTSIGVIGDTEFDGLIMPSNEPTGENGWIRQLHKVLLNKKFRWGGVTTVDSNSEESCFLTAMQNLKKLSDNDRVIKCRDMFFQKLIPHIIDMNHTAKDIEDMIGDDSDMIDYIPITKFLTPLGVIQDRYTNFREFASINNISSITFLVKRVDRTKKYFSEYGMAVYHIESRRLVVTFDPEEFIETLHNGIVAFAGELFVDESNAIIGKASSDYIAKINEKVHERMTSMETIDSDKSNRLSSLHL